MRLKDLMKMCFRNLHRRKGRTWLTISGVIIGCAAIVVMVSIGIGMNQASEAMLSQMGDLTKITVSPIQSTSKSKVKLDDKAVAAMAAMQHVVLAAPKDSLDMSSLSITFGDDDRYTLSYASVYGIPDDAFEKIGYTLSEGSFPGAQAFDVIVGQYFDYSFVDSKRPDTSNTVDYWSDPTAKPFITTLNQKVALKANTSTQQSASGTSSTTANLKKIEDLHVVGVMSENWDIGDETSYGIVMKLSDLRKLRKEIAQATPGSSTSTKSTEYSSVIVKVDDMNNVADVQAQIEALGYTTYSMETIRKPLEQQSQQLQLMLGCIGAISLLVAAIGIANTMIMSITERTREIGIMKALGCYVKDIRREFLLEAGTIGLVGGVVGVTLSEIISYLMDTLLTTSSLGLSSDLTSLMGVGTTTQTAISVIPLWLIGFAILFSVIMGLAAGFYPANKAVKISALEAIKY